MQVSMGKRKGQSLASNHPKVYPQVGCECEEDTAPQCCKACEEQINTGDRTMRVMWKGTEGVTSCKTAMLGHLALSRRDL